MMGRSVVGDQVSFIVGRDQAAALTVEGSSEHQNGADDVRDEEDLVPAATERTKADNARHQSSGNSSDTPLEVRLAIEGQKAESERKASQLRRRRKERERAKVGRARRAEGREWE